MKSPLCALLLVLNLLASLPLLAEDVTIGFEGPPTQPANTHFAISQYDEAGYHFQPSGPLDTTPPYRMGRVGPVTTNRPNNDTTHLSLLYGNSCVMTRADEGLFRVRSIQIAEYSTVVSAAKTVTFTGYKPNGDTVTTSFTTDGIIDGTGAGVDFQTFQFPNTFTGLVRLEFSDIAAYDNLALSTEAAPEPPVPVPLAASPVSVSIRIAKNVTATGSGGNLTGTPQRRTLGNAHIITAAIERALIPYGTNWTLYALYEREVLDQQPGKWVFEARKTTGERYNLNELMLLTALAETRTIAQKNDPRTNTVKGTLSQDVFYRQSIDLAGATGIVTAYGKVSVPYTLSGAVNLPHARTKVKQLSFAGTLDDGSVVDVTLTFSKWQDETAVLLPAN